MDEARRVAGLKKLRFDPPEQRALNEVLDLITALQADLDVERAAHRMQVEEAIALCADNARLAEALEMIAGLSDFGLRVARRMAAEALAAHRKDASDG